ncbi:uncharacterized protein LOC125944817 [Dermacentor silvarum]|uniref:uncharacterized protein LOC125944817 n=1 Tax=Dermacentor silvarum TaxID=543639 RepID=UPI0021009162|nr:uncharacterized protein LOC125944817 [Dermacentor silvarum]
MDSAAIDTLLQFNQRQTASINKAVQVNPGTVPGTCRTLIDLFHSDACVKAFTGVEDLRLLMAIANAVAEVDDMKSERSVLERVTIVLVRLKTFLSFRCLATLFSVSETTVHRYFYGTIRPLAAVLEAAIPWPSKAEVQQNQPQCFAMYRDVRIVLDCTEVEVEKSHCASCRILTYSHYKGVHTVKVLVGVSPGALITFLSDCFGGRASDKACVDDSNILGRLEPFKDDVMVDKGFNIDSRCVSLGIGVVQPPFLRKQAQFSQEDAAKTLQVARARVHVERAIQRLKLFRILKGPLPWEMLAVVDEAMIIIAGIVNLSAPVLADRRF